jgi:ABC-2 type transport system permease protein
MRLFSEEKRTGTIELLLTWPLKDLGVALGKFGAALGLVVVMLALTAIYPVLMSRLGQVELGPIFSGYLGIFLMGAALIALGMWFSSLTENQIIAGTLTLVALLLLWVIGWAGTFVKHDLLREVITEIAIAGHLDNFAKGVIDTRDVIYYLNFTAFFIFLTLRSLESRLRRV